MRRGRGCVRRSRGALTDLPEELDDVEELYDVDVQVRVTEAWLAALRERKYVEKFDADAVDDASDAAMPLFKPGSVIADSVEFDVDSWEYDVIALHERTQGHSLAVVGSRLLQRHSLIERCSLDTKVVQNFFAAGEARRPTSTHALCTTGESASPTRTRAACA